MNEPPFKVRCIDGVVAICRPSLIVNPWHCYNTKTGEFIEARTDREVARYHQLPTSSQATESSARKDGMTTQPVAYIRPVIDHIDQELPDLPPELLRMYALLAFTKGPDTTLEDVHDAWSLWQEQTAPRHRSLIPFGQLSEQVRELDRPYRDAIVHACEAASHIPR